MSNIFGQARQFMHPDQIFCYRSRYSNRAVEFLIMNNDNKPPARTEKRKPQDGKLQSYLEWPYLAEIVQLQRNYHVENSAANKSPYTEFSYEQIAL